jgi:exopolyphosphatase / guanosine-5'-triphosphate,3'-diphosphate pyrophosphatase
MQYAVVIKGMMSLPGMLIYNIFAMPLFASIDAGSNTLRLLIAEFANNRLIHIHTDRKITRLGNMVALTGFLQPNNMAASLRALCGFTSVLKQYGVRHVRAVATSALREARNSGDFIKEVREETGLQIEIISGEKEAQLTLKGILYTFPLAEVEAIPRYPLTALPQGAAKTPPQSSLFIMDIGGGSTEWIFYQDEDRCVMGSLPSGVIKLVQKCITTDPVSESDLERLNQEIQLRLQGLEVNIKHLITGNTLLIGTGGTFTTIGSVDLGLASYSREKIHLHRITLAGLMKMQHTFLQLALSERAEIQGLEPERADLIIPGVQFTMKVMELFRFSELLISDCGLLEGALIEMKESIEEGFSEAGKS